MSANRMHIMGPAAPWEFRWRMVIIFVSVPLIAILADMCNLVEGTWFEPQVARWKMLLGASFTTAGVFLRLWATQTLTSQTMLSLTAQTQSFITEGPFRVIRNPLYLGTMLTVAGFMLWYGWLLFFAASVLHAWRFHRISKYEGQQLLAKWGEAYRAYEHSVPRWFPRRFPFRPVKISPPSLSAIASNFPFVALMLALWLAAITRQTGFVFSFLSAGLLTTGTFLLYRRLSSRRRRPADPGFAPRHRPLQLEEPLLPKHGRLAVSAAFKESEEVQHLVLAK